MRLPASGEDERLSDVLVFQFRVLALEFISVRIGCEPFENAADGKTEIADTRFAVHATWIAGDTVERLHGESIRGKAEISEKSC